MYLTLFQIAGLAAPAWLFLIFFPTWRGTRWLARTAVFPVILCLTYVVGIVGIIGTSGFGFMRDFGNAAGVTRLLAQQDIALVAWIHILAFDQLVGIFIYRDNMEHRFVPLPIQSIVLFLTFMLGPLGFLIYYMLRFARRGSAVPARAPLDGESGGDRAKKPSTLSIAPEFGTPSGLSSLPRLGWNWLMLNPLVTWMGIIGILLGVFCLAVLILRGGGLIPPEGDLMKPATFNIAVGLYLLTLALLLPGAELGKIGRRVWTGFTVALTTYAYSIETIQAFRGLDPRFSRVASPADQIVGGVFLLAALGLIVLFVILAVRYFRRGRADSDSPVLLAIRYGTLAVFAGFASGLWMSINQGRVVGGSGSILPLHALGFHGLQAVPSIALLLLWAGFPHDRARRWVHIAGITWLAACAAVALQTLAGRSVLETSPASVAAGFVLVVWSAIAVFSLVTWVRATPVSPQPAVGLPRR